MTTEADGALAPAPALRKAGSVRNMGEPLRFANVKQVAGFAAEAAKPGQQVKLLTKLAMTSDQPAFHRLVESFAGMINYVAQQAAAPVSLRHADTVLLLLKPDATAELWVDTAATSLRCAVKRAIAAGAAVFEQDITDVTGMSFPCVNFGEADKVLCLFRQDWRFGFVIDMNPEGKLDLEEFTTTLGTIYRKLRFRHLYDAIGEPAVFNRLLAAGWFPFAEIITAEFKELLQHCEAGFDLAEIQDDIVAKFDDVRMQHILQRWLAKPRSKIRPSESRNRCLHEEGARGRHQDSAH